MRVEILRKWAVSSAVVGLLGAGVPLAHAEPGVEPARSESDVEALVEQGIELRRAGRDTEALAVFQQAADRAPASVRVRVHLASTHQALGQWLEAEQHLADVLRESEDPYMRRHRATLEKAYEFVSRHLGSLDVVGEPAGAEVLLNGRRLGQLPLASPARAPIGSYVLEVRMDDYYTVSRPVAITSRGLLRESVALGKRDSVRTSWAAGTTDATSGYDKAPGGPGWVTWTLAGLGAGAGIVGGVAWSIREQHAERWNSDECLAPNRRRGEVCSDELDQGRAAEQVAYASSIAAGLLLGGALTSFLLERGSSGEEAPEEVGCNVGLASATCFGSF